MSHYPGNPECMCDDCMEARGNVCELDEQARRLLDAWPECTGVKVSVSAYRKATTPRILALDVGFKDGTSLFGDACCGRVPPGVRAVDSLANLIDEMIARGYELPDEDDLRGMSFLSAANDAPKRAKDIAEVCDGDHREGACPAVKCVRRDTSALPKDQT